MEDSEAYREIKREVSVRVTLSTGRTIEGELPCRVRANEHHGRERVKDVLNGPGELVPLIVGGAASLVHKAFIEQVELSEPDLADPRDPDLSEHREIEVELASGTALRGTIFVSTPPGRQRTLDFFNRGERFFYLDMPTGTRILGLAHLVSATELEAS